MIKACIKTLALFFVVLTTACSANINNANVAQLGLKKLKHPQEKIYTGGQPTKAQLKGLKAAGIMNIINLRPISEQSWDEKQFVESIGLNYISIPVAGAKDISVEKAQELSQKLLKLSSKGVYVHCASGNRVGALKAIESYQSNGHNSEAAISKGKQWGLTRLEPLVRSKFSTMNK
ncbi:fused DSP-PTPase phosphatase/NAD kinase-like protein [Parashewanella tropica]|uniref:fused DSP-PTPase phosphatase/NAD kinase-like protein n=1 Tax=Parashewanella tropica TaxID=2547970 RepID=UPI001478DB88|nr:sulfur transferase domain-containing protein [Parashewanella tropica]